MITTNETVIDNVEALIEGSTREESHRLAQVLGKLQESASIAGDRHAIGHGRSRRAWDAVPELISQAREIARVEVPA